MELISEFPFMGTISRSTENPLGDDIQSTVYSGKMDLKVSTPEIGVVAQEANYLAYLPLTNPYFEKMTSRMRTKFGTQISPAASILKTMVANRKKLTATALIADQTAWAEQAYWTTFLNQDTAVFTGPEKLAIKFDYPIVFMNVKRTKRGHYEIFPELLFEFPKETTEGQITEKFTNRLEEEIRSNPATWLWSHKRWKYSRSGARI